MRRLSEIFGFIIGLSLILAIPYFLYRYIPVFLTSLASLAKSNPNLFGTISTLLVGVVTVYVTKLIEHRSSILKDLRDKKTPIYNELILFFLSAMNSDKMAEEERDDLFRKGMLDLQPRLMLWGSDKVLRLWFKLRSSGSSDGVYVLSLFDEIVREIRRDLGYRNSGG